MHGVKTHKPSQRPQGGIESDGDRYGRVARDRLLERARASDQPSERELRALKRRQRDFVYDPFANE